MKIRKFLTILIVFFIIMASLSYNVPNIRAFSKQFNINKHKIQREKFPIFHLGRSYERESISVVADGLNREQDIVPEAAGIIVLEFEVTQTEYMPRAEGDVSFIIQNVLDESINVSIDIKIPYFVKIKNDIVHWSRNKTSGDSEWLFGVPLDFLNLNPDEKLNVSFTLVGLLGIYADGKLIISVFNKDTSEVFIEKDKTISARPAFLAEASFDPFLLNISETETSSLLINITNDANYEIDDIRVEIKEVPKGVIFDKYNTTIEKLDSGENVLVKMNATVQELGVFQVVVLINSSNGGWQVIRPNLLAVTKKVIIFDEGHNQYYRFASEYMNDLLDLARNYAPVIISKQPIIGDLYTTNVTQLIIIPCPQPATADPSDSTSVIFSEEEVKTLQDFVENGGSLLLMGNWYMYFWPNNPGGYNDITEKYGIYWWDGDVYDTVSYEGAYYHVVAKNFADNEVAKLLSVGVEEVHFAGTAFKISTPEVPTQIYPILLGNENYTFLTLGAIDDPKIAEGSDVIMMLAAVVNGVGKILASGSSYMFSSYYYFDQNKKIIQNILTWLMSVKKLDLSVSGVPYEINVGEEIVAEVTLSNGGVEAITDIEITLTVSSGLINKNGTNKYSIALLKPGEQVKVRWIITANKEGTYSIVFDVAASNYPEDITKRLIVIYKKPEAQYPIELIFTISIIIAIVIISVIAFYLRKKESIKY